MSRQRKVHVGYDCVTSRCGLHPINVSNGKSIEVLSHHQFVWVPYEFRCNNCQAACCAPSPTPEMLIVIESIIVSIERLDAAAQAVPHSERGCHFAIDSDSCWCGRMTLTNPAWNAVVLQHEGERVVRDELGWRPEREWLRIAHANRQIERLVQARGMLGTVAGIVERLS